MNTETVIPRLGYLLRALITAAGYRGYIEDKGLGKDLDDLALEARPSVSFELLQEIETACCEALAQDCGKEWKEFFRLTWLRTREAIQALAQRMDSTPFPQEQGREIFFRQFTVPLLSGIVRSSIGKRQGPDAELWWQSPFRSWVHFAARRAHIPEESLLDNLANEVEADTRTVERWLAGERIGKIGWPYFPKVTAALGTEGQKHVSHADIAWMTGCLLLAVTFQSLPPVSRDAVRSEFNQWNQKPQSVGNVVNAINHEGFALGCPPLWDAAVPLLTTIQQLLEIRPFDEAAIRQKLDAFQGLIEQEPSVSSAYQCLHDWFSGRLSAFQGQQDEALRLYAAAVSGTWWFAGRRQRPIINEALLYAVGVGDKVATENYWDKTFMLGLNEGPKRWLGKQEMRHLAFGFEKMFFPQKAKDRIPPLMEVILREKEFSLDRKQLANPNRKVKFAQGRTRRTPLMDAILQGGLDDVKRLIEAGGDPNDCIEESGEGPLTYAMRRAYQRKDPAIMDYLLRLDLLPETVNRPASTSRETPLKLAIEMANAQAVTRLIELKADVEQACGHLPSALCYAMALFHQSLDPRNLMQQIQGYVSGKTPADAYDAKAGVVLDVDVASRRQALWQQVNATGRHRQIFDELTDCDIRPADEYRKVIQALLLGGADANRRYRAQPNDVEEWTPTLVAAQVGDLDVFKILVEHSGSNRGDPGLPLKRPSSLERFDALWIAVAYKRGPIISYLKKREEQLGQCT